MTAQKDNPPDGGKGRSGDVQARQSDDGSFELVVENADGSSSSDAPGASGSESAAQGDARPPESSSIGAKRLGAAVVVGLALVGVLAYAFSGDSSSGDSSSGESAVGSESDEMQVGAGFRPYLGGPSQPASSESNDGDDNIDEGVEEREAAVAVDDEAIDEAEDWEPEEQGEVVVIEEQHPPEEFDEVDQSDEVDEVEEVEEDDEFDDRGEKPKLDTTKIPKLQQRIKFPIKKPELQNLPTPKLNTLKPRLRQNRGDLAGSDQASGDETNEFEDDGYRDEEGAPEYDDQDDSFDEYDQGR